MNKQHTNRTFNTLQLVFLIISISTIFLWWYLVLNQSNIILQSDTHTYNDVQLEIARTTVSNTSAYIKYQKFTDNIQNRKKIKKEIFQIFILPLKHKNKQDAWLYSEHAVIYNINHDSDISIREKKIKEIFEKGDPNKHAPYEDLILKIQNAEEGAGLYTWSSDIGMEMTALGPVKGFNEKWLVCISTPLSEMQNNLKSSHKISQSMLLLMLIVSVTYILLIVAWLRRNKLFNKISSELGRFNTIFRSANYGMAILDRDGLIKYINPYLASTHGFTIQELLGQHHQILYSTNQNTNDTDQQHLENEEKNYNAKVVMHINQEGIEFPMLTNLITIQNQHNKIEYSVITAIDITERYEARKVLISTQKQAEFANNAKSEFLANMSHELRTPLHGILSFSKFGLNKFETANREKLYHYFKNIHASGKTLLVLLNDLLDLSKLESGKLRFKFKIHRLNQLIENIIYELQPVFDQKNIQIEFHKPDYNTRCICDHYKIEQVLRNIIVNAVKFNRDNGFIKISISKTDQTYQGSTYHFFQIKIEDGGIGIPEQELESIFNKFIQSSKTKTGTGGTGLGLSICKEILLYHKGKIWAENSEDTGAIFNFTVPSDKNNIMDFIPR